MKRLAALLTLICGVIAGIQYGPVAGFFLVSLMSVPLLSLRQGQCLCADVSITAASFKPSATAILKKVLAAGTITRGRPVIFSTSLNGYIVAAANALGGATVEGWAAEDCATGQYFLMCKQDDLLALGGTVVAGDTLWLSATGVTVTFADIVTGWTVVVLGVCTSAGIIRSRILQGGTK